MLEYVKNAQELFQIGQKIYNHQGTDLENDDPIIELPCVLIYMFVALSILLVFILYFTL